MTEQPALPVPDDPFDDLADYVAIPRVQSVAAHPGATEAVLSVQVLDEARTAYRTTLWRIDLDGEAPARPIGTDLAVGAVRVAADGSVLVVASPTGTGGGHAERGEAHDGSAPHGDDGAARGGGDAADEQEGGADGSDRQVYRLGPDGRAERLTHVATGVDAVLDVGPDGLLVLTTAPAARPGVGAGALADARRRRGAADVRALLHDDFPVRDLSVDVGLDEPRILHVGHDGRSTDLLPDHGARLRDTSGSPVAALYRPDGTVLTALTVPSRTRPRKALVAVEPGTGAVRTLLDLPGLTLEPVSLSPAGDLLLFFAFALEDVRTPTSRQAWVCRADGTDARCVTDAVDEAWISEARFHPDGDRVLVSAPRDNGHPLFWVDLTDGTARRLTTGTGTLGGVTIAADGSQAVALGGSVAQPPRPVRIDLVTGAVRPLPSPVPHVPEPGTVRVVRTRVPVADGSAEVSGWLALPPDAGPDRPVPLAVFFHGGPLGAWGSWTWGWNPWTAVRRGYAVLLPNPAMSTGFGTAHAWRGWGRWGDEPYTELLALVEEAAARPDVDGDAVALLGCSFGGYIANWAAVHTDRFRAIVAVSGIWDLPALVSSSDVAPAMRRMLAPDDLVRYSPHAHADAVRTPVLVVHGDKDFRIPVAQALAQWADLMETVPDDGDQPHRLLLFPDEHHVILRPQNQRVWLDTQLAFLDTHVRGLPWRRPELLL